MSNKVLLFVLMSFSVSVASAQRFFIGVDGGYYGKYIINQNNYGQREMDYDASSSFVPTYGIQAGVSFNDSRLSLMTSLNFIEAGQGYKDSYASPSPFTLEKNLKLKYMQIPVILRFSTLNSERKVGVYGEIGVYAGLLSKVDMDLKVSDLERSFAYFHSFAYPYVNAESNAKLISQVNEDGTVDYKTLYNSTDFGGLLGFGVNGWIGDHIMWEAGIRLHCSISDINAEKWRLKNPDNEYKASRNAYGGLNVGIKYVF